MSWFCYLDNGFAIDGDGTEPESEIKEQATQELRDLISQAETNPAFTLAWVLEYEE